MGVWGDFDVVWFPRLELTLREILEPWECACEMPLDCDQLYGVKRLYYLHYIAYLCSEDGLCTLGYVSVLHYTLSLLYLYKKNSHMTIACKQQHGLATGTAVCTDFQNSTIAVLAYTICNTCVDSTFDLVCHKLDLSALLFSQCFARSVQTAVHFMQH